jgi:hypothetical protein
VCLFAPVGCFFRFFLVLDANVKAAKRAEGDCARFANERLVLAVRAESCGRFF